MTSAQAQQQHLTPLPSPPPTPSPLFSPLFVHADTVNYLLLKVELEELPEDEDEDSGPDYPYWPIGLAILGVGGILFVGAFKWAEHSVARKAKVATMV